MIEDLERAKAIASSELPKEAKEIGVIGAVLGVSNDSIIQGMAAVMNAAETVKAEKDSPLPTGPTDYTEVERVIAGMLQESTGTNILDSGGAYGRNWQRNREIKDFRLRPVIRAKAWKDGELDLSIDIFQYLTAFLEIDPTARSLQARFKEYMNQPDNESLGWFAGMEEFFTAELKEQGWTGGNSFNSYNGESLLSQVIQGVWISSPENKYGDSYPDYLILQIHNGCDVRGGYTQPRFFKVRDFEEMAGADCGIDAACKCGASHSDDCGYHWYTQEGSLDSDSDNMPKSWLPVPDRHNAKDWQYHLRCTECGAPVRFSVVWDY